MRRFFFCVFALLLLVCGSALADTSIQPDAGDFPKDQAVRIATEQFLEASGVDEKGLHDFTVLAELYGPYASAGGKTIPRRWQVVFTLTKNPDIWYTVLIASPSGAFVSAEPTDFSERLAEYKEDDAARSTVVEQGKVWLAEKGPWWFWSYEDKAAFVMTYGRNAYGNPDTMTGLPETEDMALDQALAIAKNAIREHFSESPNLLNEMKLNAQFLPEWNKASANSQGAWMLCFHNPVVNPNGEYAMLYQAVVLSPSGVIEKIYKQDYQGHFDREPVVYSWPPEDQAEEEPVTKTGTVYYNGRGGKYYHMDAQCSSIDPKYFPLTAIDMSQLALIPYKNLRPCPYCVK